MNARPRAAHRASVVTPRISKRDREKPSARERARIARELHDQLGPLLSLVRLNLEAVRHVATANGRDDLVSEGLALLDSAIDKVRTMSFELHPAVLDELGLSLAISSYTDRLARAAGLVVHRTIEPVDGSLTRAVATACFRVFEEAGTNVMRHARARAMGVRLRIVDDMLELRVRDDGRGFDLPVVSRALTSARRLGLESMRDRTEAVGGRFTIESAPGAGTDVRARFPLRHARRATRREAAPPSPRR